MNIAIYLTDYAQIDNRGKLTAVGFGWTRVVAPVRPHSIVLIIDTEVGDTPVDMLLDLRLLDESDASVVDSSGNAIQAGINVHVARESDGVVPGITHVVLTMTGGLPIAPGLYKWKVALSNNPGMSWTRTFQVISDLPKLSDELTVTVT